MVNSQWIFKTVEIDCGGVMLFVFSHQARALIALYILINYKCKIVTFILRRFLRSHYHIECSCKTIGSYFMLPHPHNIIIAAESIGDNVQINQNVTLGGNMRKTKQRSWGCPETTYSEKSCGDLFKCCSRWSSDSQ